jgi:trypsin/VCBS repeat protein/pre-peptidase
MTMRIAILVSLVITACVGPLAGPSSTADEPLIGGTPLTGPTRAVVINLPPAGTCTGILLTETAVLTAFHCIRTGLPAGTTVSHPLGATTETANVVSAALDPLRAFTGGSPDWEHDIAVLQLDKTLSIPAGARDAALDDGSTTPTGSVECVGAGAIVEGSSIGIGTLRTLTFPITAGGTATAISLKGFPATTAQPGDSGGPCWSTASHRIVGIFQGYDTGTYVNWLTRTSGATAAWIAFQAFKTDMFDASSSQTFATTPAQWRTAKLDASASERARKQIVGITSGGLEIYGGSRTGGGPITFAAAPPVDLTALPFTFTTADADFVDVTGDGLTDLVAPTASEIDVLTAAGSKAMHFPPSTTSLGSSAWTPAAAQFGNVDGIGGNDYVWMDGTGVWVGLATTGGSFVTPTKRLSWTTTSGHAGLADLDLVPGTDVGLLDSTTVTTYSAVGLGNLSPTGKTSTLGAPGIGWDLFSGFLPVDHRMLLDPADWVAIRGQSLVTQLNDLAGKFTTFNSTQVEVGTGWDLVSTMADLNGDGMTDWIGMDDTYVYVKPGLGTGRFGRLKMQEHGLGAVSFDRIRLADIDGDGYLDLVALGTPTAAAVTVLPFKPSSAGVVFSSLTSDGTWSWADLLASMTRIAVWKALPLDLLCSTVPCGSTTGTAGKRKVTGGGLLATLQVTAQGAPQITALDDGMPRTGRWRWTPDYALRTTADLDGDGSDELVFADARGIVGAGRTADGLALVVAQSFDTAIGGVALQAGSQLANAGDTDHDGREELLVQGSAGAVLARLGIAGLEPRWSLPDTTTTRGDTAAVQQGQQHGYAALAVVPGTHVRAVTTGSGDADLYLRFGAAPTLASFDCRPYTGTANETCDLVVPQGVTTAWVMVVGYTAASYHLDVTYAPAEGLVAPAGDLDHDGYADLVVASANAWTVYRGTPQGPQPAFAAAAALGDRVIGSDTGLLVARADGIWRLTAQGSTRVMPWGLGLDASSRVVPLGDLTGDGQTDFAAIAQGTLWLFGAGANGPTVIAASGVPAGASVVAAGELDELAGAEVVVANAQQLVVYARAGTQLVPRATATLGATPDQEAAVTASAQLPRTGARRSLVVQLTGFAPPQ